MFQKSYKSCSIEGDEYLGSWEAHRGKELCRCDGVTWSITLEVRSQMQIEYKYVLIGEWSGKRYARWECGGNRSFDMKRCCVVKEVEPRFEDFQPLQSDSNGDGSIVPYHENEELTPASKILQFAWVGVSIRIAM